MEIREECATVKTLEVDLAEPIAPKPGQCGTFFLLKEDGTYGEGRVYSLSSSPSQTKRITITYRMTPNFPTKLDKLKAGDKIGFFGAYGPFFLKEPVESVVFLGGGVGITPLYSMIQHLDETHAGTKMVLIHSNRITQETPFLDYFRELEKRNANFKYVLDLTRPDESGPWDGILEKGYLTEEMVSKHVQNPAEHEYYLCGPPRYTDGAVEVLTKLGVPKEKIKLEKW